MADYGFLYIPDHCQNQWSKCDFHVHFHGCIRSAVAFNDTYVRGTGLLEMAATNNVILLFPQNNDTTADVFPPYKYCWSSAVQDSASHPQIQSVADLIEGIFS